MCPEYRTVEPDPASARVYEELYQLYRKLYFGFGRRERSGRATSVMRARAAWIAAGSAPEIERRSLDRMMLEQLKEQVLEANLEIVRRGLVLYTFGNASGIDRAAGTGGDQAERRSLRRR